MSSYLDKSIGLIGKEKIESFNNKTIAVIGVGGVGGTALEGLARSGFKKFIIVDSDVVDISNLNRQILFSNEDVGKSKVECAKNHLIKIVPDLQIRCIKAKVGENNICDILDEQPDFIVDAIDDVNAKLQIYEYCLKNNVQFISSLGMGNRLEPDKVILTTLNKTENDPLARKIRYESKQKDLNTKEIPVVFSKEIPVVKGNKPYSMIMVPSAAGLQIVKYVLTTIK